MQTEIKTAKISEIKLNPDNPRTISNKDMELLIKSLKEFPEMLNLREIVVDENMVVLGGNMRLLALQKMGASDCQIRMVSGLTPEQKREFVIKDNSNFGRYDFDSLANEWSDLPLADWGVDLPDDWLKADAEPADAEPQIDKAAELNKTWRVKPGDLWQIGDHRLLCGDSTKKEDVARVMGGEKADMVLTDPPYGMRLDTDYSKMPTGSAKAQIKSGKGKTYSPVVGDDQDFDATILRQIFADVREQFWFGADYYRGTLGAKDTDGSWLVWDKRNEGQDDVIGSGFELVWSSQKHQRRILRHYWVGAFGSAEARDRKHPTQKPTELLADMIGRWSKIADIVADPFLGSGTTMVACQNLNRKCRE